MHDFHYSVAPPADYLRVELDQILDQRGDACATLAAGGESVASLPPLWPDAHVERYPGSLTPQLELKKVRDVTVVGPSIVLRDQMAIFPEGCYPQYVSKYISSGWLSGMFKSYCDPSRGPGVVTADIAYVPFHFNMAVYGHFLTEIVPGLLTIRALQFNGFNFPIILPDGPSWIKTITSQICPENPIIIYDPQRQIAKVTTALMPAATPGPYYSFNRLVRQWFREIGSSAPAPQQLHGRRLFIVRDKRTSYRFLENHDDIKEICLDHGFEAVAPEQLSWMHQIGLFQSSSIVVGELTSALHNTVFCKPHTQVIALNRIGWVQDGIAASFGHRLGYVLPEDGRPRVFERGSKERQNFRISADEFRDRLARLCLDA